MFIQPISTPSPTNQTSKLTIYDIPVEIVVQILSYITPYTSLPSHVRLTCRLFNSLSYDVKQLRLHDINDIIKRGTFNWQLIQPCTDTSNTHKQCTPQSMDALTLNNRDSSINSIDEDVVLSPMSLSPNSTILHTTHTLFHTISNVFKRQSTPQSSPVLSPVSTQSYELLNNPPTLHACNSAVVGHNVYIYAGSSKQFDIRGSNELYCYNTDTRVWRHMLCVDKPSARTFAPLVYDECSNTLLTFGGQDRDNTGKWTFFNTLHRYDIARNKWSTQLTSSVQPCARVGHRMVCIAPHNMFVLFGGCYCTEANNTVCNSNLCVVTLRYMYVLTHHNKYNRTLPLPHPITRI